MASQVTQLGKESTCQCRKHRKTWSVGREYSLEEEMATHSRMLAWEVLWTGEPGMLYSPWSFEKSDMTEQLGTKHIHCSIKDSPSAFIIFQFSSVQSLSRVRLFATPWTAACQASLSITNFQSSLKLMSIELVMPSSHFILCCPLLLPQIPPSIGVFSNESTLPWGGQSIGVSAPASVLPMNVQGWFPLGLGLGLISLLTEGLSRMFSSTTVQKHQFFSVSLFYGPALTSVHDYWINHSFYYMSLCWQSDISVLIHCLVLP